MQKLLNQLIQLQELYFTREEQRFLGDESILKQMDKSIQHLLKKLPPETAAYFQKLQEREPPAIAPVVDGTCYGCGISLSTSLSVELFHFDRLYQCPNCSRFLYPYQGEKLQLHDESLHHKLPRMGLDKFSSVNLMLPRLQAEDKKGVITELAQLISDQLYFPHTGKLVDKALKREAIASTGVEHSLAFPHVRGIDAGTLTLALGIKKKGLKFKAPRNQLCKIFFFTVIPPTANAFYLTLLAGLIESLSSVESRKTLLSCREPEKLWETLKELTKKHIR